MNIHADSTGLIFIDVIYLYKDGSQSNMCGALKWLTNNITDPKIETVFQRKKKMCHVKYEPICQRIENDGAKNKKLKI